ncbi:homocysteine S-methyltransferase 2-like [Maniola jurtina]|uniref:homocysteine S-methyltransferase 2-like n=1 Tax=Maniola jurtina TaxID=191418 RepID=UPI001E68DA0F|nr:homocysteine S-methyltransferase 2-like [Maniola jurtina]
MASPEKVNNKVYVLDGGFSSQISRYVGTNVDGDPLWTARFLLTNPDDVYQTHLDFLRAGADVISTNTYQASITGFVKHLGISAEEACRLIRRAVELAKRARQTYSEECQNQGLPVRKVRIAGSVGPYGAYLHDGSEYTGQYADKTADQTLYEWHKPRMDILVSSGVDLLAIETIPCKTEAFVLAEMLKEYPDVKAWISFSCKDDKSLAHGENFQSVARALWQKNTDQLVGIGINCLSPNYVSNLIDGINDGFNPPIPIVTYPNSGEKFKHGVGWVEKDKCKSLHTFVDEWLKLNVKYVGGCCRTYAEDIAAIRKKVDALPLNV